MSGVRLTAWSLKTLRAMADGVPSHIAGGGRVLKTLYAEGLLSKTVQWGRSVYEINDAGRAALNSSKGE